MLFYECKTNAGTQLAGTQADAKALDRGFKQVDLPTDKAGYMAFANGLYAQIAALSAGPAPVLAKEAFAEEQENLPPVETLNIVVPRVGLPKDYRGHPDDCPGCLRSAKAAKIMGGIEMRDAIDEAIDVMDEDELIRLQSLVIARGNKLAAEKVQPVAPAPRVRIRKPA